LFKLPEQRKSVIHIRRTVADAGHSPFFVSAPQANEYSTAPWRMAVGAGRQEIHEQADDDGQRGERCRSIGASKSTPCVRAGRLAAEPLGAATRIA
jgi:hypothetical protein